MQNKRLLRKPTGACKSSWSQMGSLKSFTLTIPCNSVKLVKIFPGIIARLHHTDQKQMGLLKEQCAELRKAPLLCCRNQVKMKVGGQIPWNVTPVCETSQFYYLMVRRPMKDVLGNHLKGPNIPFGSLVEYYAISAKDQSRIHQFGKKVLPGLFLGYALYAREFGRVTYWLQTLRSWKRWTHLNSTRKTQCERGDISQRKWKIYFSNRRWTNQTPWRRSRPENIHLGTASTKSRRK